MVGEVLEPAVLGRAVPVFDLCRDGDYSPGGHLNCRLAPFLVPALSGDADQDLDLLVVDVPVVPASGLCPVEDQEDAGSLEPPILILG